MSGNEVLHHKTHLSALNMNGTAPTWVVNCARGW